ncbi:MAG: serine O-acetyltransferase EpsC [Flavitalea sp.]
METSFLKRLYERNKKSSSSFPDKESASDFIDQLFRFLFLPQLERNQAFTDIKKEYDSLKSYLSTLVYDVLPDGDKTQTVTESFFTHLPEVYDRLLNDAASIVKHDPAAKSVEEVLVAYPGFYAIAVYRFSHQLYSLGVNMLPRLFTEYAHGKTGIDIHPGASIGEGFFIDHGTGIVIGETAVIGDHVKIYQGVTIGALLSINDDHKAKRHPTIEDNVVIYAGATILGAIIIGRDSVIGGNVWITSSIPASSKVYQKNEITTIDAAKAKDKIDQFVG